MIIGFIENILEKIESKTKKWWAKYNNQSTENQVKVQRFRSLHGLIKCVNYLNPAKLKKKKCRVKYYPKSAQPIRHFGEVSEPNRALTNWKTAKKVVGLDEPSSRGKIEIYDAETGDLLYHRSTYYHYNILFQFEAISAANDTENNGILYPMEQNNSKLFTKPTKEYEQMEFLFIDDKSELPYKSYHYS